jgi:hypothetical protein
MSSYQIIGGDQREYGPVSAEQLRQWVGEGRASGDTLVRKEGGGWQKLFEYEEFADLVRPPVPPVGGVPPLSAAGVPIEGGGRSDPRNLMRGPAIALAVIAILDLTMTLVSLVAGVMGWGVGLLGQGMMPGGRMGDPDLERILRWVMGPLGTAANLVSVLLDAFILVGAVRMLSLRSWGWCMTAAILAIIPCTAPCCCLGMAAGIWSVVVLTRPEVKAAFS